MEINKAQCLECMDILESTYRWDFVTCSCGNLSVDGGKDYLKRTARDLDKVLELSYDEEESDDDGTEKD